MWNSFHMSVLVITDFEQNSLQCHEQYDNCKNDFAPTGKHWDFGPTPTELYSTFTTNLRQCTVNYVGLTPPYHFWCRLHSLVSDVYRPRFMRLLPSL